MLFPPNSADLSATVDICNYLLLHENLYSQFNTFYLDVAFPALLLIP